MVIILSADDTLFQELKILLVSRVKAMDLLMEW
jgi:hypothetical protein